MTIEERESIRRINHVYETLAEVSFLWRRRPCRYSSQVNFSVSDIAPLLDRYEPITEVYTQFCESQELVEEEKQEVYLFLRALASPDGEELFNIMEPEYLSKEEKAEVRAAYQTIIERKRKKRS